VTAVLEVVNTVLFQFIFVEPVKNECGQAGIVCVVCNCMHASSQIWKVVILGCRIGMGFEAGRQTDWQTIFASKIVMKLSTPINKMITNKMIIDL
jgi:hypothetical protein